MRRQFLQRRAWTSWPTSRGSGFLDGKDTRFESRVEAELFLQKHTTRRFGDSPQPTPVELTEVVPQEQPTEEFSQLKPLPDWVQDRSVQ